MKKLEAILPEVRFDKVPLEQVVEYLREQTGLNIFVDWAALEHCGVDGETPVTVEKLVNIPVETLLRLIVTNILVPGSLDYHFDGNVLVITGVMEGERQPRPVGAEQIMERLRRERPELHDRLMILRRENPEQFERELPRIIPLEGAFAERRPGAPGPEPERIALPGPERRRLEMEEARRHDPERAKLMERDEQLMDKTVQLAEKCRRTQEEAARKEAETELRNALSEQFDVRMQMRQLEVKDIKQRLDELTSGLDKRMKDKPNLIERRVKQLLSPDETEW